MSPQLVGWLDVSDILRAFLDRALRPCLCWGLLVGAPGRALSLDSLPACCPWPPGVAPLPATHMVHPLTSSRPCSRPADLQRDLGTIPTKMLQLMTAIEKAAPSFVARTIITIPCAWCLACSVAPLGAAAGPWHEPCPAKRRFTGRRRGGSRLLACSAGSPCCSLTCSLFSQLEPRACLLCSCGGSELAV